jgi:hypothetical protein
MGMRGYAPHYRTIHLVNDLQRVVGSLGSVRLLPPSRGVGSKRIRVEWSGGRVERFTLADARVMVERDRVHEAHGGDESPDRDECPVCIFDLDFFIRYGEGRPPTLLVPVR